MTMEMPPFETPAGHPLLQALSAAAQEAGAPAGEPIGVTYATDAGFIHQAGVPVVVFGPGSVTEAHRPDESVPLADLPIAARTYALLAHRVLDGSRLTCRPSTEPSTPTACAASASACPTRASTC